jgi:hypothetical protein
MEISPIPGIRAVPAIKAPKNDSRPSAVFDIESAFGPQQGTFLKNNKEMSGGQDDSAAEHGESAEEEHSCSSDSTVNLFA